MAIVETNLPFFWTTMTEEEKHTYYKDLGNRLQEHRYRYYVLDDPMLEDWIYDYCERVYKQVCLELGLKDSAIDMVDFDVTKPGALQASERVLAGVDHYSTTQAALEEVWGRLGKPRYVKKSEAK